jgi:glycosyltransferase involved in cell wall biosynthesis
MYGGIERIIDLLVGELVKRGHEVSLWAHPESNTSARLHPYGRPPHRGAGRRVGELMQVGSGLWRARASVDLVHSFGRLAALLPILPMRALPKVQSYQRAVPFRSVRRAVRLAGSSIQFTACSTSMYRAAAADADAGRWRTVFNGVDVTKYTAVPVVAGDAPLVFLGRLERIKGVHHAIAIARAARRHLVIAGNRVDSPDGRAYFTREIEPHLGCETRYIGPVDDRAKDELLGAAAAMLMPIEWDEPFGIVMAEAFACGTPVIGFDRGSVPEVVDEARTGFVVRDVPGAVAAVGRLGGIDRRAVRVECERRFSAPVIVDQYESLYREMLEGASSGLVQRRGAGRQWQS